MADPSRLKRPRNSFQVIILGFLGAILLGSLLLMLPISSQAGIWTPFDEALFTATSAVCVTGLIVHDVGTYWSFFGQVVILLLIQVGGLGLVMITAFFALVSGRKISLKQRSTIQDAIASPKIGGIVNLTRFVLTVTFAIEALGALIMMPVFVPKFGLRGIWMAIFHAVSAFCNGGFDVMGTPENTYQSLTSFVGQPIINLTVMSLIVIGGLGFLTWHDIYTHRHHFRRYTMQSKVIITTTLALIFIPAGIFFFRDFGGVPTGQRILSSLFQSVTMRTAGFNTVNLAAMTTFSQGICILLMLVGGSPGSTAGGMKTTTFSVLLANAVATFQNKDEIHLFGRRIDDGAIKNAATILMLYIVVFFLGAGAISTFDHLPMSVTFYETASAIGTVGVSLGVTPTLSLPSHLILILFMFIGRVGGLTLIYSTLSLANKNVSRFPKERITIG
ncbi:TrkH family potassium uptake protein [Aerococcus vaginalis]